jgi:hypothetical protein
MRLDTTDRAWADPLVRAMRSDGPDLRHRYRIDAPGAEVLYGDGPAEEASLRFEGAGRSLVVVSSGTGADDLRFRRLTADLDSLTTPGIPLPSGRGDRWWNETAVVQFDDHTRAYLRADGLTVEELVAAAESLRPADPALTVPFVGRRRDTAVVPGPDGHPTASVVPPGVPTPCRQLLLCG